jgi:hypothetical protein
MRTVLSVLPFFVCAACGADLDLDSLVRANVLTKLPIDEWRHPFLYRCPGKFETADDIHSWE